ncbi:MAG: cytochrome P450 [Acidothermaceae bacterium]
MSLDQASCPHALLYRQWEALPEQPVTAVGDHWLVSSHALVRQVLNDPEAFSPDNALDAVTPMTTNALRILTQHGFRLPHTLANNSTSSHAGIRGVVAEFLQPTRVAEQRDFVATFVRGQVAEAAARLDDGDQVDLHQVISHALPLVTLGRLIALPADDVEVVKRFSSSALELFWAPLDAARQLRLATIVGEYHGRLRLFARTGPGLAATLRAHSADNNLDEDDIVAVLFFLLVAGQETTSQFLTALMYRLLQEPAVVRGVVDGSTSVSDVVAEGLRTDTSVVTWRRVTTREVELGGVVIPAGESVVLRLAAAGRDPAIVAEPHAFVPGQQGSRRHLSFGAGLHRCLGAYLATMEAEVVVEESARLLARCQVVAAPGHAENLSFRMPDALVVARFPSGL